MKNMTWWMLGTILRLGVRVAAFIYGAEGINIPLKFMPSRWISAILRNYGAKVGEDVRFCSPLTIHNAASGDVPYYTNLKIGHNCYFGRDLFLDLADRIEIEDHVTLSHRIMILTHTDAGSSPLSHGAIRTSHAPVVIRRGAYVGAHATLLEGVEIGENSVVGAGALVTRSVPASTIVAGVPAKVIRSLIAPEPSNSQREPFAA